MIADALDGFGDGQDIERARDGAWIFHHVSQQLAGNGLILGVDLFILI